MAVRWVNGNRVDQYPYRYDTWYGDEVREWLKATVKKGYAVIPRGKYDGAGHRVYIREESAAIVFKMCWSEHLIDRSLA